MDGELKSMPRAVQRAVSNDDNLIAGLNKRRESISALLPFEEYVPEHKVFVQKDGSLGAVLRVKLIEHEPIEGERFPEIVDSLKPWLSLPENCVIQVLYDQAPVSPLDRRFQEWKDLYPNGHPVAKKLHQERIEMLRSWCRDGHENQPLERSTLVSVKYYPRQVERGTWRAALKKGEATLYQEVAGFVSELLSFKNILENLEANSGVEMEQLGVDDVLSFLRRSFNPQRFYKRDFAPYNPNISISNQVVYNNPEVDYSGITREGKTTRTLSLKTAPSYCYPGGMAYFTKLNFPFQVALNFSFPTRAKVKRFLDMKEFFLQDGMSARAKYQMQDIQNVQNRLARDDRAIQMTFTVSFDGKDEAELDRKTRAIVSVFHNDLQCETIVEERIGFGLWMNNLPLAYNPKADNSSQRAVSVTRSDALRFLPIFDSYRGLVEPLQVHLSRENNLVPFNLFENETSQHSVVLADSGSGKSAFILSCAAALKLRDPEPYLFVVDKKSSYMMFAEYFDANVTVFDPSSGDIPFSCFRGHYDEQKFNVLTNLILTAVQLTSPSFNVDSEHRTVVNQALKLAYVKKLRQSGLTYLEGELVKQNHDDQIELSMDDFIVELSSLSSEKGYEKMKEACDLIVRKLRPFYGDGMYARYFRGGQSSQVKKNCRTFVYDLDALDSDPILKTLMSMSVMEEIRQIVTRPENQGIGGQIIFEEVQNLGKDETASSYVSDFAQTLRKLGFWLVGLTPIAENYYKIASAKALWNVSDNFIFLTMSDDNLRDLAKNSSLLDEADRQIVNSLRTIRGKHAEVYYIDKKKQKRGAFRYIQTPYDSWLAPTNAKAAREAAAALERHPGEPWKALEELVERYPRGM